MARVQITIHDIDMTNIGVDVHAAPMFPENKLMWTNAQLVAHDLIQLLQNLGKQINQKAHQEQLMEASRVALT